MQRQAAELSNFGSEQTSAGDITNDAIQRINRMPTRATGTPTDGQDKTLKVVVTGNVQQKKDGTMDLNLSGGGVWNAITNALGGF